MEARRTQCIVGVRGPINYLVRRAEFRRQVDDLIEQLNIVLQLLLLRQLPC